MTYAKPEVVVCATVINGVRSQSSNKQIPVVQDHINPPMYGTSAAYEADE
ncbi:MAG: hypothetical protein L0338_16175 [Acidobacteria bacterium]|nr:hypothetical protein [Acidobacteriota bacterium]